MKNILGVKRLLVLRTTEVDDTRKHQDHVPTLVHDRRMAVRAADLARQLMVRLLVARVVERQALGALLEVQVFLLEDGCPLEWRP